MYLKDRTRREMAFTDVLVGIVISDGTQSPTFGGYPGFYGTVRAGVDEGQGRLSEPRPWLDPTITCRRGHRLKVPLGRDLKRLLERTPAGEPIYLPKAPPKEPIALKLEPVPRA